MNTKTCTKCQTEKSVDLFYKDRDRYTSACKQCRLTQQKQYYIDNKATVKVKRAAYQKAHRPEQYEHLKKWRKNNIEKNREAGRRQYAENIEHRRAVKNAWREANVEKIKSIQRKYALNNPEKTAEKQQIRKVKMRSNGVYKVSKKELIKLYSSPCIACGTTERVTIDHIIPIARGGIHGIGNLQSMCLKCNASKNNRTMSEWKFYLLLKGNQNGALRSYN
jgi:5-methylcytosine-specific restriction endonuclease McrA